MIGMFGPIVLIALLGSVVVSAGLLVTARGDDAATSYLSGREADLAHLVMNSVMAWMLTPWFGPGSHAAAQVGLVGLAVVFGVLLLIGTLRTEGHWRERRPSSAYHLVAAICMAYAMAGMTPMGGAEDAHAMHGAQAMAGMSDAAGPSVLAWILAAVFALDGLATLLIVAVLPASALTAVVGAGTRAAATGVPADPLAPPPGLSGPIRNRIRVAAFPHTVMDLAMVLMLTRLS